MAETKTDVIQLRVTVDGSQGRKELAETQQAVQKLRTEQEKLREQERQLRSEREAAKASGNTAELKRLNTELAANRNALGDVTKAIAENSAKQSELRKEIGITALTLGELRKKAQELRSALASSTEGSDTYKKLEAELVEVEQRMGSLGSAAARQMRVWEELRKTLQVTQMTAQQLGLEEKRLQQLMANPNLGLEERAALNRELGVIKQRQDQLTNSTTIAAQAWENERKSVAFLDMSLEQLEKELIRLRLEQSKLNPNAQAAEFNALGKSIQRTEDRVKTLSSNLGPLQRMWRNVKAEMTGMVGVAAGFLAGGAIVNQVGSMIKGAASLSDSLANVKKATGLTKEEVVALNKELSAIDTRTATEALRGIAIGLGQAGEAVNQANVEAIDRIVVALGDEFGDDATGIANTLSVLRNNLSDIKSGNYAQDVTFIGNALNELGANGLATAPVVSDIANRVAGVARTFKISSGEILGTAATFQELGISTERGSTAYIKLLQKMASEPAKFGAVVKAAGMDANQFASDINNNMQGAFITLARAAQKAGTDNAAFAGILKELDVDGAGVSELLAKIGTNYGMLQEKTDLASKALKENTSIFQEFADKNTTLGAELDKLGKDMNRLFSSQTAREWFGGLVTTAREAVQWISANRDAIVFWAKVLGNATVAWATYRVTTAAVSAASTAWLRIQATMNAATLLFSRRAREAAAAQAAQAAATTAGATATAASATATVTATTAQKALNTAMKLNPIGLIISGITTLIALFTSFGEEVSNAADEQERLNANLKAFDDAQAARKDINTQMKAVGEMNKRQLESLGERIKQEKEMEEDRQVNFRAKNAETIAGFESAMQRMTEAQERGDADRAAMVKRGAQSYVNLMRTSLGEQLGLVDAAGRRRMATEQEVTDFVLQAEKKRLEAQEVAVSEALKTAPDANAAAGGGGGGQAAKTKDVVDGMQNLRDQLAELRMEMLRDGMSADARELDEVDAKYEKLRAEIMAQEKWTADDLDALDEAYYAARQQVRDKQHAARLVEEKKKSEEIANARLQIYVEGLSPEKQELARLEQEFNERKKLFSAGSEELVRLTALYEKRRADVEKKYANERAEIAKAERLKKIQNYTDTAQAVGGVVTGLQSILAAQAEAQGRSAAEQTEFQRQLALTQIGIATSVSIANALSNIHEPFPANLIAIATSIGAVMAGIGQAMAVLNSTPPTPSAPGANTNLNAVPLGSKGGMVKDGYFQGADGGVLQGPSHSNGGLGVYNEGTGQKVAEFEGGEAYMLLSKKFTDLNRDQLGQLLQASRNGSRIRISGGRGPLPMPNPQRVSDAMDPFAKMAAGGMVATRGTALVNVAGPGSGGSTYMFKKGKGGMNDGDGGPGDTPQWAVAMLGKMDQMVNASQAMVSKRFQAEVVLSPKKDRTEARYAAVKARNTYRRSA